MRDRFPVNILIVCFVFLFVIYLTSALDLALTASFIAASILFRFRSVWLFLIAIIVFTFYLVTIFLSLKIKFITDFSVSAYLLFASGILLYFLEGQPAVWTLNLPVLNKVTLERNSLVKFAAILLFVFLVYPLTGPYFGAIFGYLAFLYIFQKSEGRYAFMVALFFLILCPFLLIFKKDKIAETSAIFTYYFLVIGVVQEIIDMIRNPTEYEDEELPPDDEGRQIAGYTRLRLRRKSSPAYARNLKLKIIILLVVILSLTGTYFGYRFLITGKKLKISFNFITFKREKRTPELIESILPSVTPTPTLTLPELKDKIATESFNLRISVLNGTDIPGLASTTSAKLKEVGFRNVTFGNSPENYQNWQLSIKEKDDNLINYLKQILELNLLETKEASQDAKFDLEIIAGVNSD